MSSRALGWAMQTRRVSDPVDRLILLFLGDQADQCDEATWLFEPTIENWTGLDEDPLYERVEKLVEAGVLRVVDWGEAELWGRNAPVLRLDVDGDEP